MKKIKEFKENENIQSGIKWYREKIIDMVNNIEDNWILEQILKCIINITK